MTASSATAGRRLPLVLVLGLVTAIGPLTIDLYLPSLPLLEGELRGGIPAELTLGGTVVGLGLGQFFAGTLSDRVGRRSVLLGAIALHALTAIACALAPTMLALVLARVLMGVASAGGAVVSIAIVRDTGGGTRMLRALAALAVVSGIAPLIAPVLGSQLLYVTDWRGIFLILAGYSVTTLLVATTQIGETLPVDARRRRGIRATLGAARHILADRFFLALVVVSAASWCGLFTHLASAPFLMTETFGLLPTQYGPLFVAFAVGYVGGVQVAGRLGGRLRIMSLVAIGLTVQALGGALMLATAPLASQLWFVVSAAVAIAGIAMCLPTTQTLALQPHGTEAGLAASLLGGFSLSAAGAAMIVITMTDAASLVGLGIAFLVFSAIGNIAYWFFARRRTA